MPLKLPILKSKYDSTVHTLLATVACKSWISELLGAPCDIFQAQQNWSIINNDKDVCY